MISETCLPACPVQPAHLENEPFTRMNIASAIDPGVVTSARAKTVWKSRLCKNAIVLVKDPRGTVLVQRSRNRGLSTEGN